MKLLQSIYAHTYTRNVYATIPKNREIKIYFSQFSCRLGQRQFYRHPQKQLFFNKKLRALPFCLLPSVQDIPELSPSSRRAESLKSRGKMLASSTASAGDQLFLEKKKRRFTQCRPVVMLNLVPEILRSIQRESLSSQVTSQESKSADKMASSARDA